MSQAPRLRPDYRCDLDRITQNVPACLRELHQWVCWRWKWNGKKWTKLPVNPLSGGDGDATDRNTWGSFDDALSGVGRHQRIAGVGFVFAEHDPYCGVDLDNCIELSAGLMKSWARQIVRKLNCYCEISPSGAGLKLFLKGCKPGARCKSKYMDGEIEMYDRERFFTITGCRVVRCLDDGRVETD